MKIKDDQMMCLQYFGFYTQTKGNFSIFNIENAPFRYSGDLKLFVKIKDDHITCRIKFGINASSILDAIPKKELF